MTAVADLGGDLAAGLKEYWGYDTFRPLQAEAAIAVCSARDAVIVLPTGGGKSVCYQLPAVVHGRAIVVSPLISLMRDQVSALTQLGVPSAFINSSLTSGDAREVQDEWKDGKLKLLYVAPERLLMDPFLRFLAANPPAFFAIDEA